MNSWHSAFDELGKLIGFIQFFRDLNLKEAEHEFKQPFIY